MVSDEGHSASDKGRSRPGPFRGEVWWMTSSSDSGRRPVAIVQNDVGNTRARTVIVAAVSAGRPERDYPQMVPLDEALVGRPATVRTDVLQTVEKDRLLERAAVLPRAVVADLDAALRRSLALT